MAKPGDKKLPSVADAPDSVSDEQKDDAAKKESPSTKLLTTLIEKQQETTDGITTLIEATEGNKETKEDQKEEENKRKSFFDGIKGMFKNVKEGTPNFFDGIKKMIGKYKKILIGLVGAGLVAFFATMKMEDFAKIWKSVKKTMVAAYEFLKPIAEELWKWLTETAFPATIVLLLDAWKAMAKLFENLKTRFKGWTESDWGEKLWMLVGSLEDIGDFVMDMGAALINWVARLFGYEGSLTKDISKKFSDFGESLKQTFKNMLYAILPTEWADSIINKLKQWFGDDASTPEDESLVGRLGGIFKAVVGALALSLLFPGGFALLMGGIVTVITTLFGGLLTAVVGITSAIFTWPVLLGVAIAAFVIWVGKLIYDNWDTIKKFFVDMWESVMGFFKKGVGKVLSFLGIDTEPELTEEEKKIEKAKELRKQIAEEKAKPAAGSTSMFSLTDERDDKKVKELEAELAKAQGKNVEEVIKVKTKNIEEETKTETKTFAETLKEEKAKSERGKKYEEKRRKHLENVQKYRESREAEIREKEKKAVLKKVTGVNLDQLKLDEGFKSSVYKDTEGIKTVGYGFNLEREGAQEALDAAGIKKSLADLKSGDVTMTEEEADRLMRGEYPHFADAAKRFVGATTWNNLTLDRQKILTNMAYNMGESGLNQFKKLKAAIQKGDWKEAQTQMASSKWAGQVKGRSDRLAARMGQNDSGIQLAAAQTAGGNLDQVARSNVIIAPSTVNQNNNSTPLHLAENTFTNDQVNFHST
jgi:lysozyme